MQIWWLVVPVEPVRGVCFTENIFENFFGRTPLFFRHAAYVSIICLPRYAFEIMSYFVARIYPVSRELYRWTGNTRMIGGRRNCWKNNMLREDFEKLCPQAVCRQSRKSSDNMVYGMIHEYAKCFEHNFLIWNWGESSRGIMRMSFIDNFIIGNSWHIEIPRPRKITRCRRLSFTATLKIIVIRIKIDENRAITCWSSRTHCQRVRESISLRFLFLLRGWYLRELASRKTGSLIAEITVRQLPWARDTQCSSVNNKATRFPSLCHATRSLT